MNREIKYRVFDNVDYMSTPFNLYDLQTGKIQFSSECKIMQFTGLKDKNGVEIFEGDIIKTDYYSGTPGKFNRMIGNIIFHRCSFMVFGINKYEGLREELHGNSEVIGNIYQHPDLIN